MLELVEAMKSEFDYILIDCPAGIEQGYETAVIGADWAIVVTNPEISAVRVADKIIGRLQAANKEIKLIVNRIRPQMVKDGTMTGTVLNDDLGQATAACETVLGLLAGKAPEKKVNYVPYVMVTPANVDNYLK